MDAFSLLGIGVATGVTSLTITRSKLFRGLRHWLWLKSDWLGDLIHCPYCMSHWIALAMILGKWPGWKPALVQWLVAVAIAAPVSAAIYLCMQVIQPAPEVLHARPETETEAEAA